MTDFFSISLRNALRFSPREYAVLILTAVLLIAVPWSWGGVVFWTVAAAFGVALVAFLSVFASYAVHRGALIVWLGCIVAVLVSAPYEKLWSREALDYLAFPIAAFVAQLVPFLLLKDEFNTDAVKSAWRDLVRLIPFWLGVLLFGYFAIQALNPWGRVVERDLFWKIYLEKPIAWLPSGLAAPLTSDEDPGGMNAWRVMLILGGPWLLFCALRVGLTQRRAYIILGWIAMLSASVIAIFCFLEQPASGEVLGFKIPPDIRVFGVFMNRNHGGTYLYLNAALALSLTFWHIRRAGGDAIKGGPHLISAFLFLLLSLFAIFSNSVGALIVVSLLVILVLPLTVFRGAAVLAPAARRTVYVTLAAVLCSAVVLLSFADFGGMERKLSTKLKNFKTTGIDDRAPLRAATWEMATAGGTEGKVWTGWGAGSYRWVSPYFQARQPALQDKKGHLQIRAVYAHCDWLQMLAEWGVIGVIPVLVGLIWLARYFPRALASGLPETIPLVAIFIFFVLHASFDLLCWFTPILFTLVFLSVCLITFLEKSSLSSKPRAES